MTAVKAADVERVLASPAPRPPILLFYGPDQGRIAIRARRAALAAVDDPDDAFQLVRVNGDELADEPARLVEEATTFGLFGGRRAIWLRVGSRNVVPAVKACLETALVDVTLVIEAGDLSRSAPLRVLCEQARTALALPCYADEARDLASLVTEALARHRLAIDRDARELLIESLGGDRLATEMELEKLALSCAGKTSVSIADVEEIVSDVSASSLDTCLDAAFCGDRSGLEHELCGLERDGTLPASLLAAGLRHGFNLSQAAAAMATGLDREAALRSWRGLHFRRRPGVLRQLELWRPPHLRNALSLLQTATLDSRRLPAMASALGAHALIRVAALARASGRL